MHHALLHQYNLICPPRISSSRSPSLSVPPVGTAGQAYAAFLGELVDENDVPRLVNHFYNFYFAHTAGGRSIGKKVSSAVLDGEELEFYR